MTKTMNWALRPAQTQISLDIRPANSIGVQYRKAAVVQLLARLPGMQEIRGSSPGMVQYVCAQIYLFILIHVSCDTPILETSNPKGNDRSPESQQVF